MVGIEPLRVAFAFALVYSAQINPEMAMADAFI
jgi:hypothetical protein